jgi:predicted dehydrogenase
MSKKRVSGEGRKVRWGVLGCSRIGSRALLPAFSRARNCELAVLASRDLKRAQEVAEEHAIPAACSPYEGVLEDPSVEALYIPLPNDMHRDWAIRAIQAGKHVLCEKPLGLNAGEAQEIADAAQEAGVLLMEGVMYRYHPRSRRIKSLVDEGAIGEPKLVHAAFSFDYEDLDDYRYDPERGGGALMDVGIYGVSLARWIFSGEPETVDASAEYGSTGIDLTTVALLLFPGGRMATVQASFGTALQMTYTIVGKEGSIELPHNAFVPGEDDTTFELRGAEDEKGQLETIAGADQYQLMVEHFADAVLDGVKLEMPPQESVSNLRVLDAVALSAREGRVVALGS